MQASRSTPTTRHTGQILGLLSRTGRPAGTHGRTLARPGAGFGHAGCLRFLIPHTGVIGSVFRVYPNDTPRPPLSIEDRFIKLTYLLLASGNIQKILYFLKITPPCVRLHQAAGRSGGAAYLGA